MWTLLVMEHPGHVLGLSGDRFYAPTARYGTPKDFMAFVDRMHQAGIGVILDWVPAHFPWMRWGCVALTAPCYEHADNRRAEMHQRGTMMFDYARGEVSSFMLSNACYWLEHYHIDGLRCDAVSSMIYLNFALEDDYLPNQYGGHENLDAMRFLKRLNETVYHDFPGVMMIAEESSRPIPW